jgi:hypothetical protein
MTTMLHGVIDRFQRPLNVVAYSTAGFIAWWLCLGVVMRVVAATGPNWAVSEIVMGLGMLGGAAVAVALRMSLLAWFLAACVGYSASELTLHAIFGIKSVQGGPAHFTILGAALLAVIGFVRFDKRFVPMASVMFACVLAFIAAEALSHLVFGLDPFRDRVTHVAVFGAALIAAAFASVVAAESGAMV